MHGEPIICDTHPLMASVHENLMQSAKWVFCDATSFLDKYNVSSVHCLNYSA